MRDIRILISFRPKMKVTMMRPIMHMRRAIPPGRKLNPYITILPSLPCLYPDMSMAIRRNKPTHTHTGKTARNTVCRAIS